MSPKRQRQVVVRMWIVLSFYQVIEDREVGKLHDLRVSVLQEKINERHAL